MAISFSVLLGVYFGFLIRAGYWAIKELGWIPVSERETFTYNTLAVPYKNVCPFKASGDLAFLVKLLENSNAPLQYMFDVGNLLIILEAADLIQHTEANNDNVLFESSI